MKEDKFSIRQKGGTLTEVYDGRKWPVVRCGSVYVTGSDTAHRVTQSVLSTPNVQEKKRKASKYTVAVGTTHGHVQAFVKDSELLLPVYQKCPAEEKCLILIKKPKDASKKMLKAQSLQNLSVSDTHLYKHPLDGTLAGSHRHTLTAHLMKGGGKTSSNMAAPPDPMMSETYNTEPRVRRGHQQQQQEQYGFGKGGNPPVTAPSSSSSSARGNNSNNHTTNNSSNFVPIPELGIFTPDQHVLQNGTYAQHCHQRDVTATTTTSTANHNNNNNSNSKMKSIGGNNNNYSRHNNNNNNNIKPSSSSASYNSDTFMTPDGTSSTIKSSADVKHNSFSPRHQHPHHHHHREFKNNHTNNTNNTTNNNNMTSSDLFSHSTSTTGTGSVVSSSAAATGTTGGNSSFEESVKSDGLYNYNYSGGPSASANASNAGVLKRLEFQPAGMMKNRFQQQQEYLNENGVYHSCMDISTLHQQQQQLLHHHHLHHHQLHHHHQNDDDDNFNTLSSTNSDFYSIRSSITGGGGGGFGGEEQEEEEEESDAVGFGGCADFDTLGSSGSNSHNNGGGRSVIGRDGGTSWSGSKSARDPPLPPNSSSDRIQLQLQQRSSHHRPSTPPINKMDPSSRSHSLGDLTSGLTISLVGQKKTADSVMNVAEVDGYSYRQGGNITTSSSSSSSTRRLHGGDVAFDHDKQLITGNVTTNSKENHVNFYTGKNSSDDLDLGHWSTGSTYEKEPRRRNYLGGGSSSPRKGAAGFKIDTARGTNGENEDGLDEVDGVHFPSKQQQQQQQQQPNEYSYSNSKPTTSTTTSTTSTGNSGGSSGSGSALQHIRDRLQKAVLNSQRMFQGNNNNSTTASSALWKGKNSSSDNNNKTHHQHHKEVKKSSSVDSELSVAPSSRTTTTFHAESDQVTHHFKQTIHNVNSEPPQSSLHYNNDNKNLQPHHHAPPPPPPPPLSSQSYHHQHHRPQQPPSYSHHYHQNPQEQNRPSPVLRQNSAPGATGVASDSDTHSFASRTYTTTTSSSSSSSYHQQHNNLYHQTAPHQQNSLSDQNLAQGSNSSHHRPQSITLSSSLSSSSYNNSHPQQSRAHPDLPPHSSQQQQSTTSSASSQHPSSYSSYPHSTSTLAHHTSESTSQYPPQLSSSGDQSPSKSKRTLPDVPLSETSERIKRFTEIMKSRVTNHSSASSTGRNGGYSADGSTTGSQQNTPTRVSSVETTGGSDQASRKSSVELSRMGDFDTILETLAAPFDERTGHVGTSSSSRVAPELQREPRYDRGHNQQDSRLNNNNNNNNNNKYGGEYDNNISKQRSIPMTSSGQGHNNTNNNNNNNDELMLLLPSGDHSSDSAHTSGTSASYNGSSTVDSGYTTNNDVENDSFLGGHHHHNNNNNNNISNNNNKQSQSNQPLAPHHHQFIHKQQQQQQRQQSSLFSNNNNNSNNNTTSPKKRAPPPPPPPKHSHSSNLASAHRFGSIQNLSTAQVHGYPRGDSNNNKPSQELPPSFQSHHPNANGESLYGTLRKVEGTSQFSHQSNNNNNNNNSSSSNINSSQQQKQQLLSSSGNFQSSTSSSYQNRGISDIKPSSARGYSATMTSHHQGEGQTIRSTNNTNNTNTNNNNAPPAPPPPFERAGNNFNRFSFDNKPSTRRSWDYADRNNGLLLRGDNNVENGLRNTQKHDQKYRSSDVLYSSHHHHHHQQHTKNNTATATNATGFHHHQQQQQQHYLHTPANSHNSFNPVSFNNNNNNTLSQYKGNTCDDEVRFSTNQGELQQQDNRYHQQHLQPIASQPPPPPPPPLPPPSHHHHPPPPHPHPHHQQQQQQHQYNSSSGDRTRQNTTTIRYDGTNHDQQQQQGQGQGHSHSSSSSSSSTWKEEGGVKQRPVPVSRSNRNARGRTLPGGFRFNPETDADNPNPNFGQPSQFNFELSLYHLTQRYDVSPLCLDLPKNLTLKDMMAFKEFTLEISLNETLGIPSSPQGKTPHIGTPGSAFTPVKHDSQVQGQPVVLKVKVITFCDIWEEVQKHSMLGRVFEGDILVEINGWFCLGADVPYLRRIVENCQGAITLTVARPKEKDEIRYKGETPAERIKGLEMQIARLDDLIQSRDDKIKALQSPGIEPAAASSSSSSSSSSSKPKQLLSMVNGEAPREGMRIGDDEYVV